MIDTGKEIKYHSSHAEATITIQGSRSAMKWCDIEELAIHINPEELHQERNAIAITEKHLFLPPTIQVVHSEPHVITITLNEKLT